LHRSWEVSTVPDGALLGGAGKGNRNPAIDTVEKSDAPVVPEKPPNKGKAHAFEGTGSAEAVEGRGAAKGNAGETPAGRTPSRETASKGLEGIRETAKRDKRVKFTALLHHITPSLLVESFYDLNKTAAVGVDGVTWRDGTMRTSSTSEYMNCTGRYTPGHTVRKPRGGRTSTKRTASCAR